MLNAAVAHYVHRCVKASASARPDSVVALFRHDECMTEVDTNLNPYPNYRSISACCAFIAQVGQIDVLLCSTLPSDLGEDLCANIPACSWDRPLVLDPCRSHACTTLMLHSFV